jgi:hypothetical protein
VAKYQSIWKNYLPAIYFAAVKSEFYKTQKSIDLNGEMFECVGDRQVSGYKFRLEINNGLVQNNISGTIVARDLFNVLVSDNYLKSWMKSRKLLITVNQAFVLKIKCESPQ